MNHPSIKEISTLLAIFSEYKYVLITQGAQYYEGFENSIFVGNTLIDVYACKEEVFRNQESIAGLIGYDLKNEFESLSSQNIDYFKLPTTALFKVEESFSFDIKELNFSQKDTLVNFQFESINPLESKEEYLKKIEKIQQYILEGEVYELNYCVPVKVNYTGSFNPLIAWITQCLDNPNPFAALFKCEDNWVLCNSPERFINIKGNTIQSQPIKGTKPRVTDDALNDAKQAQALSSDIKERAENVMIVDLVRNDLARIAKPTTVEVPSLFEIQTLPTVFQMVSTVKAELKESLSFFDILKATFPMGSMTGAPKIRAMEIIEELEVFQRNAFSGSLGYCNAANGVTEWNVVIRSLFYNQESKELYFVTGSAITIDAIGENEWEELQWKAKGIVNLLEKLSNIS